MGLFRRRTRVSAGDEGQSEAPGPKSTVDDFEVPGNQKPNRRCSDNECPCGSPGAAIEPGTGYLYIAEDVVQWRRDARSVEESEHKAQRLQKKAGMSIIFDQNMISPTLMCEQGAKRRGLDLDVAAADARRWWETGRAPLRPTPRAAKSSK
jgi:hypothetical protein